MARKRKHLPPGAKEYILQLAQDNALQETKICKALGLHFETWRRILRDDEDAKALWEHAKAIERDSVLESVYTKALEGDMQAARFLLAARHGMREQGSQGDEQTSGSVVINLPPSMSETQYKRLFEQSAIDE